MFIKNDKLHGPNWNDIELTTQLALQYSIEKWETIVEYYEQHPDVFIHDQGPLTCGLCVLFFDQDEYCFGCPIARYTGKNCCDDTPYESYNGEDDDFINDAIDELEFLRMIQEETTHCGDCE